MSGKARPSLCRSILKRLPYSGLSNTENDCIQELCELHIPKKPNKKSVQYGINEYTNVAPEYMDCITPCYIDEIRCPNCEELLRTETSILYCSHCGQAIDWSENNETINR